MKTINDFKVINEVAILEGVAYAEEAKVVDDYLKANNQVNQVSVISKDGRNFELKNGKLVLSNGQVFLNPYFHKEIKALNPEVIESKVMNINEIENQLKIHDEKIDNINYLLKNIAELLKTNLK